MTWWILLALAAFLTWLSLRYYNFVFSLTGMLMWFAVWGYNLNTPPAGVTIGTFLYDVLYYAFFFLALATFLGYFRGRRRQETTTTLGVEDGKIVAQSTSERNITEPVEEYRQRVRRALNPNRRRR